MSRRSLDENTQHPRPQGQPRHSRRSIHSGRAARALRQAHESARRAFDKGAAVSRAYNWLHVYNHPAPGSNARSMERWNREIGTRIGAAATSAGQIGPGLVSAMQGGLLLTSSGSGSGEHSTPHQGRGQAPGSEGQSGLGTTPQSPYAGEMPEYGPDTPQAGTGSPEGDAPNAPAPDGGAPGGDGGFWDFVY
jgi:hypothetical protein